MENLNLFVISVLLVFEFAFFNLLDADTHVTFSVSLALLLDDGIRSERLRTVNVFVIILLLFEKLFQLDLSLLKEPFNFGFVLHAACGLDDIFKLELFKRVLFGVHW